MKAVPADGQALWLWLFQRVTGALLVIGIGVHFHVGHYTGLLTSESVAERLRQAAWLGFDLVLVALLAFHGINGLRNIVRDYNPRGSRIIDIVAAALIIAMVLYCARDLSAFRSL